MKKSRDVQHRRKLRSRSARRKTLPANLPAALPLGTLQALMGLAAFEARRS